MLPPVIEEGEFSPFKFWFDDGIQDGMYYKNELFYRLHTTPASLRARLYHYACKLAQTDRIVVTAGDETCSIWVSLRSPNIAILHAEKQRLSFLTQPSP